MQPDFSNAADLAGTFTERSGADASANAAWLEKPREWMGRPLWAWTENLKLLFGRISTSVDGNKLLSVAMVGLLADFHEVYEAELAKWKVEKRATLKAAAEMDRRTLDPAEYRASVMERVRNAADIAEAERVSGEILDEAERSETVAAEADGDGAPGKPDHPAPPSSSGSSGKSSESLTGKSSGISPSPGCTS